MRSTGISYSGRAGGEAERSDASPSPCRDRHHQARDRAVDHEDRAVRNADHIVDILGWLSARCIDSLRRPPKPFPPDRNTRWVDARGEAIAISSG